MNNFLNLKPQKRSKTRIFFGKNYYILKRKLHWLSSKTKYSKIESHTYSKQIFKHETPLYRKLRNVDMWMQENKVVNLKIAVNKINGMVINPGETFSYWKTIGNPTSRKGYKPGMILHYGKFISGTGGGLCQLSNLIYWLTLHTPLSVTERHRHGFDVFPDSNRTQPFGSGATCVYNYRDLQITNNTNEIYQINIIVKKNVLFGQINSNKEKYFNYELYEKNHKITSEYWGGYIRHNEIYRKVFDLNNNEIDNEYLCENHALMMYEPLLETKSV